MQVMVMGYSRISFFSVLRSVAISNLGYYGAIDSSEKTSDGFYR